MSNELLLSNKSINRVNRAVKHADNHYNIKLKIDELETMEIEKKGFAGTISNKSLYRYYPQMNEINAIIKKWAITTELCLTSGSDYHGGTQSCHKIFEWFENECYGF